ncbi:MAG: type II toxin-antitoxin system prevent-host-death family antitoxin [Chloroflexota bacterium]|nr:type II toxin-antitoxin system prevent-host-death family antitoxin [Chloroflexota bacterium]
MREQVGVRELRQNLSVHLRRVRTGATLEVTDHGRPVAILAPLPEQSTPMQRLVASGMVLRPATKRLVDLPPPMRVPRRFRDELRRALEEQREDRI